ncbi:hypothetical protein CHH61_26205, partial [Shouchella clausii]
IQTAAEMLNLDSSQIDLKPNHISAHGEIIPYKSIYKYLYDHHQATRVEGHFYLPKEKEEIKGSGGAPHH